MENNVNHDMSFNPIEISIEKTLHESNKVLFYNDVSITTMKKYECKVIYEFSKKTSLKILFRTMISQKNIRSTKEISV